MKKLVYVGSIIVGLYCFSSYGLEKSETSVSLLAAHGKAISLPTVNVQFHDMLPQVSSSVSLIKPLSGGGSKRSSASSSEGDSFTLDTDTEHSEEPSFSTLPSAPTSPEHSPKDSMRKKILSHYDAILKPIQAAISHVPGLDEDQCRINAEQLTRNILAQVLLLPVKREVEPVLLEQDDVQLKQELKRQIAASSDCCVIL